MVVNDNCGTTLAINTNNDSLPSSECQICFFFFRFPLIFEVVFVVINLFFVCAATVDDCLLTELADTRKTDALHTRVC